MEGGGDKKAEVIVVHTMDLDESKQYDKDGICARRIRFHQVDLSEGKITRDCFPSMMNCIGYGAMVRSDDGPVVYLIGGLTSPEDRFEPTDGSDDEMYYKCGCRLDVQKQEEGRGGWEQIDLPIKNRFLPRCASLFGKLYEFGYPRLDAPEVFDPSVGFWKESSSSLPPELVGCKVSDGGVIPDPRNARLLVHLSQGTLHAFYPTGGPGGEWKLIGSLFHWSNHNVALVDGVLYIHHFETRDFIYAYDVARCQHLKVTWSSKMCQFSNGYRVNVTKYKFDAMFYAGDGHFWMATWSPSTRATTASMFFKFKADCSDNGLRIVCTPIDIQCHDLQNTSQVIEFVQLQEAGNWMSGASDKGS